MIGRAIILRSNNGKQEQNFSTHFAKKLFFTVSLSILEMS